MKELIAFEFRKMFKLKKTWILFFLLVAMFIFAGIDCEVWRERYYDVDLYEIMYQNDQINLTNDPDNPLKMLNDCKENKCLSEEFLKYDINYCKEKAKGLSEDSAGYMEYNSHIVLDRFMLKNKVPYYRSDLNVNGLFFISNFTKDSPYFLPLIFIILCADIFNKERKGGTQKLLMTQPFSKKKIIMSKYLCCIITSVSMFTLAFVIYLIVSTILYGWIPLDYPTTIIDNYSVLAMSSRTTGNIVIPLYYFFILSFVMALVFIIAIVTISFFLSLLFKKKTTSMLVPIMLCILVDFSYFFWFGPKLQNISPLNIFSYMSVGDIFYGYHRDFMNSGANPLTVANAIVVPLIYTAVFLGLSFPVIKRKQFKE